MGKTAHKAKYRALYEDHFENANRATQTWKPRVQHCIESQSKKISKFIDVVEFIDDNMQTAIRVSYDHDKTLDENLEEYKEQKAV